MPITVYRDGKASLSFAGRGQTAGNVEVHYNSHTGSWAGLGGQGSYAGAYGAVTSQLRSNGQTAPENMVRFMAQEWLLTHAQRASQLAHVYRPWATERVDEQRVRPTRHDGNARSGGLGRGGPSAPLAPTPLEPGSADSSSGGNSNPGSRRALLHGVR